MANVVSCMAVSDECKRKFLKLIAKRNGNERRYAFFNFDFIIDQSFQKSKLFFIAWSPFFKVRSMAVYASSKDRFNRQLDGTQVELQATDPSEMSFGIVIG
ncbi:hypothetical protein ACB098_12G061000 [Castanea mollissima]